jgi:hypothetical protein
LHELALEKQEPRRSGAEVMRVAALITAHSVPLSVVAKIDSPTVSGRVSTELVMISGQRKLFQWWLTDTSPKASIAGLPSGT